MNEVSIIINGVRYDAVEGGCKDCHLPCNKSKYRLLCHQLIKLRCFKKSDKKFEL